MELESEREIEKYGRMEKGDRRGGKKSSGWSGHAFPFRGLRPCPRTTWEKKIKHGFVLGPCVGFCMWYYLYNISLSSCLEFLWRGKINSNTQFLPRKLDQTSRLTVQSGLGQSDAFLIDNIISKDQNLTAPEKYRKITKNLEICDGCFCLISGSISLLECKIILNLPNIDIYWYSAS